jgi:hypothetical protein
MRPACHRTIHARKQDARTVAVEVRESLFDDDSGHSLDFAKATQENGDAGFWGTIQRMYGLIAISPYKSIHVIN